MHPNPRKIIPVLFVVVLAGAAWWYFRSERVQTDTGMISASGTIEATQVSLAPEMGGKVVEILANKGDTVQAGKVLIRFEDALLRAQLGQAQAALAQAQANYDLVAAGLPHEQREVAIVASELELINAQQAIDELFEKTELIAAQAYQAVVKAEQAVEDAQEYLDNLQSPAPQVHIDQAKATLLLSKIRLDDARKDYEPYENKPENNKIRAALFSEFVEAETIYDGAVRRLNNLLGNAAELDIAEAEAGLELAKANLDEAEREYAQVKDRPDPDDLILAETRLAMAQANLAAAQADPSPEQLAAARSQIAVAQAALEVIQAQIDKLALVAPIEGIVLSRSVEPGEVVVPGSPMMTLARLDDLTITVYVSEDRYGTINLGQDAQMVVDSFPGETFNATVVRIADQAEFTPRNVQTEEGRRTTVFAVELSVENPTGKLKPGMPADVEF
jgi:multidrug resistance efflux pump